MFEPPVSGWLVNLMLSNKMIRPLNGIMVRDDDNFFFSDLLVFKYIIIEAYF